jgi:pyruvate formate lyase activating enzyme
MYSKIKVSSGCVDCGFCEYFVNCPAGSTDCLGCGTCLKGCPAGARSLAEAREEKPPVKVSVNGIVYSVPSRITISRALEILGIRSPNTTDNSHDEDLCRSGGCFKCAVLVDGQLARGCSTEVLEGMEIVATEEDIEELPPLRVVSQLPSPLHTNVVSIFTHGCNFSCGFCHNWDTTFSSTGRPLTPQELARFLDGQLRSSETPRLGISGGEPTLNRRWLVDFIEELKMRHRDLRIQVDTNASLLTGDYLDELYDAGMTDISPDIKASEVGTFMKVTGVDNRELARRYLETSWQAIEYIVSEYSRKLYYVVAIPYHPAVISGDEIHAIGKRLASLDKNMDVNLIEYQPAFRMRYEEELSREEIERVKSLLNDAGLKKVWCQAGPNIPRAVDPEDLLLPVEF